MIFNILSLEMLAITSLVDLNNYLQLHVLNIRFIEFVHGTGFIRLQAAAHKVLFIISCGLQSRVAYNIDFFTLSKGVNDAESFLGYDRVSRS